MDIFLDQNKGVERQEKLAGKTLGVMVAFSHRGR